MNHRAFLLKEAVQKRSYSLLLGPVGGGAVGGTMAARNIDPEHKERIKKILYGVMYGTGGGLIGGVGGQLAGGAVGGFGGKHIGRLGGMGRVGGAAGMTLGALLGAFGGMAAGGRLGGIKASE